MTALVVFQIFQTLWSLKISCFSIKKYVHVNFTLSWFPHIVNWYMIQPKGCKNLCFIKNTLVGHGLRSFFHVFFLARSKKTVQHDLINHNKIREKTVAKLLWVTWVPWNPSIFGMRFSNPSIFGKFRRKLRILGLKLPKFLPSIKLRTYRLTIQTVPLKS